MNLSVRRIEIADLDELHAIFLRTYSQDPWNEIWDHDIARQRLIDLIGVSSALNFCALTDANEIVGAMFGRRSFWIEDKEYFVDEFFVDHDSHRNGIGHYMVNEVSRIIKNEGYSCIVLNTERDFPSERFYLKNGFAQKTSNIFMYKKI